MASQDQYPDINVSQERESTLNDLGASKKSILSGNGKKKGGTLVMIVLALAALFFVYTMKQDGDTETGHDSSDITIASKTKVSSIPVQEETPPMPEEKEPPAPVPAPGPDPMELERQRLELARQEMERQLMEARMKSSIISSGSQNIDPRAPESSYEGGEGALDGSRGAQDKDSRFARSVSGNAVPLSSAVVIPDLDKKILQGKLIEAILLPRAVSDLPGSISCQVARDVYSEDGSQVLIPWGSKIFGQYNAGVRKGQDRLFVVWNRLVTPSGVAITLDSPGADQLGTAGMGGTVDTHFWEMFSSSLLLSLIGAGATHLGDTSSDGSAAYYKEEMYEAFQESARTILSSYANIPPTINVAPGTRVRILIARDLDFSEVLKKQNIGQAEKIKKIF